MVDIMKSLYQPNTRQNLKEIATSYDRFGDHFRFKLPGNKYKHGTVLGCFFTSILVCALLIQIFLKAHLFASKENRVIRNYEEGYFDSSHELTSADGLKFAFAITDLSSDGSSITEDLDYGRVAAVIRSWAFSSQSNSTAMLETEL